MMSLYVPYDTVQRCPARDTPRTVPVPLVPPATSVHTSCLPEHDRVFPLF